MSSKTNEAVIFDQIAKDVKEKKEVKEKKDVKDKKDV